MNAAQTPLEALQLALQIAGTQAQLASICGVSQPAVWKWLQSSKRVPAEHVLAIEASTGVSRHHLRPDIYLVEMPQASSRWSGIDQCAGIRTNGVDSRSHRVAFNREAKANGAAA